MTTDFQNPPPPHARRPYRPPIGIPVEGEPRARATAISVALHVLVFLAVVAPTLFLSSRLIEATTQGGGGPGPVGGGGGGNRGGGPRMTLPFVQERLDYLQVQPPEPVPKKKEETPQPKIEPPKPAPPPPPVEEAPAPVPPPAAAIGDSASGSGAGTTTGGSGSDGSAGDGPGRGGGVGSGVGTGRGSGTGPGRGGGEGDIYPPTVVALPILPLPIPSKVRPYKMVARFEVDEEGNAKLLDFNPSRDSGYNRRIREMLAEIRFRPAVGMDGKPVRAIAVVTAEAM